MQRFIGLIPNQIAMKKLQNSKIEVQQSYSF